MSNSTPGPWAYAWTGGSALVFLPGEATIASVPFDNDSDIPQAEANARLIAAAPDLLSWLKWSMKHLPDDVKQSWQYEAAQAAIAKATGEAT